MTVFLWAVAVISNKSLCFHFCPPTNLFFTEQTASSFKTVHFQNTLQWLPMQAGNENLSLSLWLVESCPDPHSSLLPPLGCPELWPHGLSTSCELLKMASCVLTFLFLKLCNSFVDSLSIIVGLCPFEE